MVQNPFEGVKCALVIAGSDKRGTIYGLFHLSECMGVSPLVDWSHVMPAKRPTVKLSAMDCLVSKEPSVKYRGIFINDEWPAMWSACFSMDGPGLDNAILADELGIVIGTSHHEPLVCETARNILSCAVKTPFMEMHGIISSLVQTHTAVQLCRRYHHHISPLQSVAALF